MSDALRGSKRNADRKMASTPEDQSTFRNKRGLSYEDRQTLSALGNSLAHLRLLQAARVAYWWALKEGWRFNPARILDKRYDAKFDRAFRVKTQRRVDLTELEIQDFDICHGVHYQATSAALVRRILSRLNLDHSRFVFVDLGSGKGRVLLMAAQLPFKRVIGVEIAEELIQCARRNIDSFLGELRAPIELVHGNAADYSFPPEPTVLFMFNPFDETVMSRVIENLLAAADDSRKEVLVVYHSIRCRELFDQSKRFRILEEFQHTVTYSYKGTSGIE